MPGSRPSTCELYLTLPRDRDLLVRGPQTMVSPTHDPNRNRGARVCDATSRHHPTRRRDARSCRFLSSTATTNRPPMHREKTRDLSRRVRCTATPWWRTTARTGMTCAFPISRRANRRVNLPSNSSCSSKNRSPQLPHTNRHRIYSKVVARPDTSKSRTFRSRVS